MGKCYACGMWNTYQEQTVLSTPSGHANFAGGTAAEIKPVPITDVDISSEIRLSTGMSELDRVLGGGAVLGKAGKAAEKNLKKVLDKRRSLRYNKQAVTKTRQRAGP